MSREQEMAGGQRAEDAWQIRYGGGRHGLLDRWRGQNQAGARHGRLVPMKRSNQAGGGLARWIDGKVVRPAPLAVASSWASGPLRVSRIQGMASGQQDDTFCLA